VSKVGFKGLESGGRKNKGKGGCVDWEKERLLLLGNGEGGKEGAEG